MKAQASLKLLTISILIVLISPVMAQEYDDMYYTHSDRKADKNNNTLVAKNTEAKKDETSKKPEQYGLVEENYSSKNLNPEYIARYRNSKDETDSANSEGDSYYVEDYNRNNNTGAGNPAITNNYYNYPSAFYSGYDPMFRYNMYNSMMWDPYMAGGMMPGWNFGVGYSFGYMPGWSFSLSYGNTWGGYNPYAYNPWGYGYYDPWGWNSWSNPYHCYGMGYSSNYYASYYPGSYYNCATCYNDNYGDHHNKNVIYGRRSIRSSGVARITNENNTGRSVRSTANTQSISKSNPAQSSDSRTRVSSQRDYSTGQNEYYSRGRTVSNNNSGRSAATSAATPNRNYNSGNVNTTRTRTSSSSNDYSRPTYHSSRVSSTSGSSSGNYNRSSGSRTSSNSWNSSSSGSNSYERSSRSTYSGSSYSGGSSSGSRSSSSGFSGGSSGRSSSGGSSSSRSGRGN